MHCAVRGKFGTRLGGIWGIGLGNLGDFGGNIDKQKLQGKIRTSTTFRREFKGIKKHAHTKNTHTHTYIHIAEFSGRARAPRKRQRSLLHRHAK